MFMSMYYVLLCVDQFTSHILHSAKTLFCFVVSIMSARVSSLGCCCRFDLQLNVFILLLVVVTAAIVNILSLICVSTLWHCKFIVLIMLSYV